MITGSVDALRRLVQEPSVSGTYTNSVLSDYLAWANGDMYGAGYMIWTEKIAALKDSYDISAGSQSLSLNQKVQNAMQMQSLCAGNRGVRTNQFIKDPTEPTPEPYDEEDYERGFQ